MKFGARVFVRNHELERFRDVIMHQLQEELAHRLSSQIVEKFFSDVKACGYQESMMQAEVFVFTAEELNDLMRMARDHAIGGDPVIIMG